MKSKEQETPKSTISATAMVYIAIASVGFISRGRSPVDGTSLTQCESTPTARTAARRWQGYGMEAVVDVTAPAIKTPGRKKEEQM